MAPQVPPQTRGNSLAVMAWRNLWRNRRRTLLALASIVFGVFLAVLMTAMQDRMWADMIDLAARTGGGHVTVQHPEYRDTPTMSRSIAEIDRITALAQRDARVERTVARIVGHAMVNTATESFGAAFIAFDPRTEDPSTLALLDGLERGEVFSEPDARSVVLGSRLAHNLGVDLGDKLVYTLTDRDGEITSAMARVSGTVRTGSPGLDAALTLLPIDAVRSTVGYGPGEATQLAVFLDDQRSSDTVARELAGELGGRAVALPWSRARPDLASFIAVKVGGALFMELLIAVLVAAGIFNALFVSVMERVQEFGIMLAIGWSPGKLFRLIMIESLWMGLVGLVAAALFTLGPYLFLADTGIDISQMLGDQADVAGIALPTTMKIGIFPKNLAIIAGAALLAVLLSGIYPAWRAGRVDPVETLNLV